MIPSKYEINVARADGVRWDGSPAYKWFCRIDAGDQMEHANKVAETVRQAFPAPEYCISLHQKYAHSCIVNEFDWRVGE